MTASSREPVAQPVVKIHFQGQPDQVRAVKAVVQSALHAAGYTDQPTRPAFTVIRGGGDRR